MKGRIHNRNGFGDRPHSGVERADAASYALTIRDMQESDLATVQEITRLTWAHTYRDLIPSRIQEHVLRLHYSGQALRQRLKQSGLLMAEAGRSPVGFADFAAAGPGEAELMALYVLPAHQGRGAGSMLLAEGIRRMALRVIYVSVEEENEAGKRFYRSRGFEQTGESKIELEGMTFDLLRMRLVTKGEIGQCYKTVRRGEAHVGMR